MHSTFQMEDETTDSPTTSRLSANDSYLLTELRIFVVTRMTYICAWAGRTFLQSIQLQIRQ
jgi:hypothetical protein